MCDEPGETRGNREVVACEGLRFSVDQPSGYLKRVEWIAGRRLGDAQERPPGKAPRRSILDHSLQAVDRQRSDVDLADPVRGQRPVEAKGDVAILWQTHGYDGTDRLICQPPERELEDPG